MKKEALKKYKEARKGLTEEQIKELDAREAVDRFVENRIRALHAERFTEEYDHMGDSHLDSEERSRGINPMSAEYTAKVNERRVKLGVEPLSANGLAQTGKSMELCREEVLQDMKDLYTRVDEILFYKWDPIRLSNSNSPRDEYTTYVDKVLQVAVMSDSPEPIAKHLTHICNHYMGLSQNVEQVNAVANLIFSVVHNDDYFPDHEIIEID